MSGAGRVRVHSVSRWCAVCWWAASSCALFAQPAFAQPVSSDVERSIADVRDRLTYAEYDTAIQQARTLLASTSLDASQRNRTLEVLAIAYIANRDEETANQVLRELFARDPRHRLSDDGASPRIQAVFARARDAHTPPVAVALEVRSGDAASETPEILARPTTGADAVQEVRLAYRQGGDSAFTRVVMPVRNGIARAAIPVPPRRESAHVVEYFVEALAPSLHVLATSGSEGDPLRLSIAASTAAVVPPTTADQVAPIIPETDDSTVFEEWWFWTLVVLAVGGGVTAGLFLGPLAAEPPEGSLGSIRLQ
jgi:hypothetical protein